MTRFLRSLLRKYCLTANTIRYRVEWPRLAAAMRVCGPVETLFDGGAGSGEFARRMLDHHLCRKVIALEPATFSLLRQNLGHRKEARLIEGSLLEVPLSDASVDLAMSTQVIEHIEDHEKAAAEMARITRPGGWILITVPHPPEHFPQPGHVREGYTPADLTALLAPLGCAPVHTDWFLTRPTTTRFLRACRLPLKGVYLPVAWADCETALTPDERRAQEPFGILMLFQKMP